MALVNCPECGRENVSSSAESCPGCGYNIKAHYANAEKARTEEINKQARIENAQKDYQARLEKVEMPIFPEMSSLDVILGFFAFALILIGLIYLKTDYCWLLITIGIGMLIFCYFYDFRKSIDLFKLSKSDPDSYRKLIVSKAMKEYNAQPIIRCPVCGSTTVDKISTLDRTASVTMVGLASGKIGKQYKCRHCGHMW